MPIALQSLVDLAVRTIHACDWAAVTAWPPGESPCTRATSDDVAVRVDEIQYSLQEGPCLEAAGTVPVVSIDNVAEEERWPRFCHATAQMSPVRSVLSLHLGDGPERSALNLYAGRAHAFSEDDKEEALMFALQAKALILHAETVDLARNLKLALANSREIGTALGVLMALHRVTSDEALTMMKDASNARRMKLRDVARYVVHTGELPPEGFVSAGS